jgi:hypothetical protein
MSTAVVLTRAIMQIHLFLRLQLNIDSNRPLSKRSRTYSRCRGTPTSQEERSLFSVWTVWCFLFSFQVFIHFCFHNRQSHSKCFLLYRSANRPRTFRKRSYLRLTHPCVCTPIVSWATSSRFTGSTTSFALPDQLCLTR